MAVGDRPQVSPAESVSLAGILENSHHLSSRDLTLHPIDSWLLSPRDISARLVHFSAPSSSSSDGLAPASYTTLNLNHHSGSGPSSPIPSAKSIRTSSSMAPALVHQSNASMHPPSLYHYSDATPTETSVDTGLASRFSGVPLLESVPGEPDLLERRTNTYRTPIYECAFWFLNCPYVFGDEQEWRTHCLAHLRGEEPPQRVQCPLCEWTVTLDDGHAAWSARMDHVAHCHTMLGETLKTSRPDFDLFHYLWQRRLIDDQDLKELKGGNHNLTRAPGNYVTMAGRRERGRGRQGLQRVGRTRPPG